jgi:hypothetical protein
MAVVLACRVERGFRGESWQHHGPEATMALLVEVEHVLGNLEPFVHAYGAAAVMVILTFESLGLPIPGESVLVFASVFAGRGELSLLPLMLSAWAGAVVGDNIGYLSGSSLRAIWSGNRRVRKVRQYPPSVERCRGGDVENGVEAFSRLQCARRRALGFVMDVGGVLSWRAWIRHQGGCP